MSGKGSGRRPQQAPEQQVKDSWGKIFGEKKLGGKFSPNSPNDKHDRKEDVPKPK